MRSSASVIGMEGEPAYAHGTRIIALGRAEARAPAAEAGSNLVRRSFGFDFGEIRIGRTIHNASLAGET